MIADAKPSEITRDTERIFWIYYWTYFFLSMALLCVALFVAMVNTTGFR